MLSHISTRQKVLVMLAVMSGMMLAALDQTIVATALPRIVSDLHGLKDLSWVVTAYLLTSTISVPISGKLSDIFGRKKLFLLAILLFVAGSALSGISQNMAELIGFRAFQGIGAGMLMSMAFAVIGDLFAPAERARWQGIIAGVFGLASVIGPLLGGYLTDHASWRWNFYINVPVGILAFFMISTFMPHIASDKKDQKIDFLGAGLLAGGLTSLLLATVWGGNQYAWGSWQIIGLFVLSAALLLGFGRVEHAHAKDPILPLDFFRNSIFRVSMLVVFFIGIAMFGAILYLPLFAQDVLGRTATNSGVILTPMVLSLMVVSLSAGQFISRTGRYKILSVTGTAVVTIGILWLSTMNIHTTGTQLVERMVVIGAGLGISMPIFNLVVQNAFEHAKLGVATASVQLSRSIGATVGVALMGTILNNQLTHRLANTGHAISANQLSSLNPRDVTPAVKTAMAGSITEVFLIAGLLVSLAFFTSWFLKEIPLRTSHEHAPANEHAAASAGI
ncbi:MAG: MDR family MFS transporter [Candidatus Saccharimonadales bacterium]